MLTVPGGPVVCGEETFRALHVIRRANLLPALYDEPIVMAHTSFAAMTDLMDEPPPWLNVFDDPPRTTLPPRCRRATASQGAAIRLALALPASLVLLEEPIKEKVKLSFIKAEGTLSILVGAYRIGRLSAVRPMVKALQKLGHGHVLPAPEMLEAMWKALEELD